MIGLAFSRFSLLPQKCMHLSAWCLDSKVPTSCFALCPTRCQGARKPNFNSYFCDFFLEFSWTPPLSLGFHIHFAFSIWFPGLWDNQTILCILKCMTNYENITCMFMCLGSKWLFAFYKTSLLPQISQLGCQESPLLWNNKCSLGGKKI